MTWPNVCLEKVTQVGGERVDSGGRVGDGQEYGSKGAAQHGVSSGAGSEPIALQPLSETQRTDRVCGSDCAERAGAGRSCDQGSFLGSLDQ